MRGRLRRLWRRLRGAPRPAPTGPDGDGSGRVPGRAHLVLRDGSVVEAPLAPEDRARVEYLARRAVAPPPPAAKPPEHPL